MIMNDKIKELKDLLWELDNKYNQSVPETQQNINECADKIVKLFAIPVVVRQSEQLVCSCGSIKVQTTGGSQCPNNRCSSAN